MSLRLRVFRKDDRTLVDSCGETAKTCLYKLHDHGFAPNLFVEELAYGDKLWANQQLLVEEPQARFQRPIGVVLEGALEVTESFLCGNALRRRTTAILRKGEFFGLFEAFANLKGYWEITAGIQRFLITSPLGNRITLRKKGWGNVSEHQIRTLKHQKEAEYDYSEFVRYTVGHVPAEQDDSLTKWKCKVVLFDLEKVQKEPHVKNLLLEVAIKQLASWAHQNPPDALFSQNPSAPESAEHLQAGAAIDAILAGHIPVFCPYDEQVHQEYGPLKHMLNDLLSLRLLDTEKEKKQGGVKPIEFWVPDYWTRANKQGALYLDALAKKFEMKAADELLSNSGPRGKKLRSGTRIVRVGDSGAGQYNVRVTTNDGKSALIHRIIVEKKTRQLPRAMQSLIFPPPASEQLKYAWPLHLGTGMMFCGIQ